MKTALLVALIVLVSGAAVAAPAKVETVEAKVQRVVDGDTLAVTAHIWVKQSVETLVRIAGIDTPELKGACKAEKTKAKAAKDYLEGLFKKTHDVRLKNVKTDKYGGRVVADVHLPDGRSVAKLLIKSGHARPYKGGKRKSWCP